MKVSVTLFFFMFFLATVFSQTKTNAKNKNYQVNEALNKFTLAQQLLNSGFEEEDPLSMLMAVQIIKSLNIQNLTCRKEQTNSTNDDTMQPNVFDTDAILEEATNFAEELPDGDYIRTLIETEIKKGRIKGSLKGLSILQNEEVVEKNTYYINYKANELAELIVIGNGNTDIDLFVYDENGEFVAGDEDYSDKCYVSFVPVNTQEYKIEVVNTEEGSNVYTIVTN